MGENLLHVVSRGLGVGDSLQNWASRPPYLRLVSSSLVRLMPAVMPGPSPTPFLLTPSFPPRTYSCTRACSQRGTLVYTQCATRAGAQVCSFSAIRITPSSHSTSCLPGLPVPSWPPLSRASMAAQHKVSLELPCWLWVVWRSAQFCSPGAQRVPGSPKF